MTRFTALALVVCGLTTACGSNTAPGNDRESRLDAPEPPAEPASVAAAVAGVSPNLLHPGTMTEADLASVPDRGECLFRFTKVGLPIFAYSNAPAAPGTMKLNGRLVSIPGSGGGVYDGGGVRVQLNPIEPQNEEGEPTMSEFVLMLPQAEHELGYRGFSECGPSVTATD